MEVQYEMDGETKKILDVVQVRYNPSIKMFFFVTKDSQISLKLRDLDYISFTDYNPLLLKNITWEEKE